MIRFGPGRDKERIVAFPKMASRGGRGVSEIGLKGRIEDQIRHVVENIERIALEAKSVHEILHGSGEAIERRPVATLLPVRW